VHADAIRVIRGVDGIFDERQDFGTLPEVRPGTLQHVLQVDGAAVPGLADLTRIGLIDTAVLGGIVGNQVHGEEAVIFEGKVLHTVHGRPHNENVSLTAKRVQQHPPA
jgi:predicted dinucleotide-utilizing enzyme